MLYCGFTVYADTFLVVLLSVAVCCVDQGQQARRTGLTPSTRIKGSDSESHYDTADDDILDSVLRSAAHSGASRVRNRTRARNKERKSCKYHSLLRVISI